MSNQAALCAAVARLDAIVTDLLIVLDHLDGEHLVEKADIVAVLCSLQRVAGELRKGIKQ